MKNVIVYIGGFELPDKNAAAHRVLANAQALNDLGYRIIFIGVNRKECSKHTKQIKNYRYYEVKYPNTFFEWLNYVSDNSNIYEILNKIKVENIHALCLYNYPSIAFYKLLIYSKKNGIKVFADITEWPMEKWIKPRSFIKNLDTLFRMEFINLKTDGLITISTYLTKYYTKKKHNNIIQIPPLIVSKDQKWKDLPQRSNLPIHEFIYAGSPGSGRKDRIDYLINAFISIYKDGIINFRFRIIGITKEQFFKNFDVNKRQDIPVNIEFEERKPHSEVMKIIASADFSIFIRPKNTITKAGFPTKFVESISCGTPVITNNTSDLLEYFQKFKFSGILIDDLGEDSLKKALIQAMNTPKSAIQNIKNECFTSKVFDYSNFKDSFQKLLHS